MKKYPTIGDMVYLDENLNWFVGYFYEYSDGFFYVESEIGLIKKYPESICFFKNTQA